MWKSCQSEKENAEWSPGVGLSKYRHQASHRNCAGTPSTLLAVFSKAPLQRQCSVKHPFKITLYMTLSTPSPESCTIIKILNTVPSAIILRVQPLGSRVDEW